MPGRGTPWRGVGEGKQDRIGSGEIEDDSLLSEDIKDGTIKEIDLDTALQAKVNAVGGTGHTIQDEGTPLTQRTNLNFIGSGVVASDGVGDTTDVTISGGGGTGGLFYASLVWGEIPVGNVDSTGTFGPLLGTVGVHMGETGVAGLQGAFGRAGKVSNFTVRVASHVVGTTSVNLIKNGVSVKTYSFSNTDVGTTVTDSTETTFTSTDLIRWEVSTQSGAKWVLVAEYDFS